MRWLCFVAPASLGIIIKVVLAVVAASVFRATTNVRIASMFGAGGFGALVVGTCQFVFSECVFVRAYMDLDLEMRLNLSLLKLREELSIRKKLLLSLSRQ